MHESNSFLRSGGHFLPTPHSLSACLIEYGELDSTSAVCALVHASSFAPPPSNIHEPVFSTGLIFSKFSALLDTRTCMWMINLIFI